MTQQGDKHISFNDLAGTSLSAINGDFIEGMLADEPGIQAETINGIFFEWLGLKGYTGTTLQQRMNEFAQAQSTQAEGAWENIDYTTWENWSTEWESNPSGPNKWSSLGTFTV